MHQTIELFNAIANKHFYEPAELYETLAELKPGELSALQQNQEAPALMRVLLDDIHHMDTEFTRGILAPFPQLVAEAEALKARVKPVCATLNS